MHNVTVLYFIDKVLFLESDLFDRRGHSCTNCCLTMFTVTSVPEVLSFFGTIINEYCHMYHLFILIFQTEMLMLKSYFLYLWRS